MKVWRSFAGIVFLMAVVAADRAKCASRLTLCCCREGKCTEGLYGFHTQFLGSAHYCCLQNYGVSSCSFSKEAGDLLLELKLFTIVAEDLCKGPVVTGPTETRPVVETYEYRPIVQTRPFVETTRPVMQTRPLQFNLEFARLREKKQTSSCQLFADDGPKVNDVEQGVSGDCYLVASFMAIAHTHPNIIKGMFITDANSDFQEYPVYRTRWYPDGIETIVAVDDQIPWKTKHDDPLFAWHPSNRNVVWPAVLEKAYAKIFKSYTNIEAGLAREALRSIAGAPDEVVWVECCDYDGIWSRLTAYNGLNYPMVVASKSSPGTGIMEDHAFVLLGVGVADYGRKYVSIMQPHGHHSYAGELQGIKGPYEGSFRMTWEEFLEDMDYVHVAYIKPDHVLSAKVFGCLGPQFEVSVDFTIDQNEPFTIIFEWTRDRFFDDMNFETEKPSVSGQVTHPSSVQSSDMSLSFSASAMYVYVQPGNNLLGSWKFTYSFEFNRNLPYGLSVVAYAAKSIQIDGWAKAKNVVYQQHCQSPTWRLKHLDVADFNNHRDIYFPPDNQQSIGQEYEDIFFRIQWKRLIEFCK